MDLLKDIEFEDKGTKESITTIVNIASNYDIYDFIARVAGLNLLSQNQNKSVLLDTLLQYILSNSEKHYHSSVRMSDKKFRLLIETLNDTNLAASIDPCENTFVQNVMFITENYRVFNGIDITPAYNLQALIKILFNYDNRFNTEYLKKVYALLRLVLNISEYIADSLEIDLDNIVYDETQRLFIPDSKTIKDNACIISIPILIVQKYISEQFPLEEICNGFGENNKGNINNRPFYTSPFLINSDNNLIILNISLLPAFVLFKAFEWADEYGIKEAVISKYNDYIWFETKETLDLMGHKKIKESSYGIKIVSNDYYKESIRSVYNNQIMIVIFICDDGNNYNRNTFHDSYPDNRHQNILKKRVDYFKNNINTICADSEDIYLIVVINSIGRSFNFKFKANISGYRPISLNPFELHCIAIHEHENLPFLPRYIRSKSHLKELSRGLFSELNAISLYTSNHNSFYIDDNIDLEEASITFGSGDSIEYITEALIKENRILINSYDDEKMTEVILKDKVRNIFVEDLFHPQKHFALCNIFSNVQIWIITDDIINESQINIYASLLDAISYWLAECKSIIENYSFPYNKYTIRLLINGKEYEYYYDLPNITPFENCIDCSISNAYIDLGFYPEAYRNMNQSNNSQEKELIRFIINIFDNISYEHRAYNEDLDSIFKNPLKKKFYSAEYDIIPYLKPLKIESHRYVHEEDEDYLYGIVGKELLKTGNWEFGIVDNSMRYPIAKDVVGLLYNRLQMMIEKFDPKNIIEVVYQDLEETMYRITLAERKYYSEVVCYPENEKLYSKEYNELNKTSISLKFLIEYVTACPPSGSKHFGIGQYEELLAICSLIIDWAYKGDLFKYDLVNTPVEFLKSKRIGMQKNEFVDMYQYNENYRNLRLKYDSSLSLRKEYNFEKKDFGKELENAFISEFGYSYSEFIRVIETMVTMNKGDIICVPKEELPIRLITLNDDLTVELISKVIKDIVYSPRKDFLTLPKGYNKEDAYPWRYNRKYSFNRRPVLERGNDLIWGNRQLYHMVEYLTDLIYSEKFKANSDEMKSLCGKIAKSKGDEFNELIFEMLKDMDEFLVIKKVSKINGLRITEFGKDLGDIDILIIDEKANKIIVAEVKNFRFSRNPYEIYQENAKMFVDKNKKMCFATKHLKRMNWVRNHIADVKQEYKLDNREWKVSSLFIFNQPLISQHIYKQKIKCISKAELSVEAIRNI